MKFRKIFSFEFACHIRSVSTWLYFLVMVAVSFLFITGNYIHDARNGDFFVNAPIVIASVTVFGCLIWLLVAAAVAGDAATRDMQTRMLPLTYTSPLSKAEYLGGRFLAAFVINALMMLALPAGMLVAIYLNGVEAEIIGPFQPAAYFSAYFFIAFPNAFVGTAIQFTMATLQRRPMASYLGGLLLFLSAYLLGSLLNGPMGKGELGNLVDPISFSSILNKLSDELTPIEKNTRLILLQGPLLLNRLFWIGIAMTALVFTWFRFRFTHSLAPVSWWHRITGQTKRRLSPTAQVSSGKLPTAWQGMTQGNTVHIPGYRRDFGFVTQLRQTGAITWTSFRQFAMGRAGLPLFVFIAIIVVLVVPLQMKFMGVSMLPETAFILTFLTAPLTNAQTAWIIIPLLITFYTGELVWRERDARLSEITGTSPVPEWVLLLGKFLGVASMLLLWLGLLTIAGILVHVSMGGTNYQVGLFLQVLYGLQLPDYLLFAVIALFVHVIANQKYIGHLVVLLIYGLISFAPQLGIEHKLLVYGSDTGWSYSGMRGFGSFFVPWLMFKLYWAAWALLLLVLARLFWVRSRERGIGPRLQLAHRRITRHTAAVAAISLVLIFTFGGYIFYNTNILNHYTTASDKMRESADYELRYRKYKNIPQPGMRATKLEVEIYPDRGEAAIRGTYTLWNSTSHTIDTILLTPATGVQTRSINFDRPAAAVALDTGPASGEQEPGMLIYKLSTPLAAGDSFRLSFRLQLTPRGFSNHGVDPSVTGNGSYLNSQHFLPAIGYQQIRELTNPADRKKYTLTPRPANPSLYNLEARRDAARNEQVIFEAVVATGEDQVAVAPGSLQREWTVAGRRYFHYVTAAPIHNSYALYSAKYALHESEWRSLSATSDQVVLIQLFYHPGHAANIERMARSVRASLDYYSRVFGPYPHSILKIVEHPGQGKGMHAEATTIDHEEGFSLLDPKDLTVGLDLPFYVVAHEVAHQWWGYQLVPARVEGAGLLTESLATFSAMQVLGETYGTTQLRRYLDEVRKSYEVPRTRASVPLLRTADSWLNYRKGPFALYAMSNYIGRNPVNAALRSLLLQYPPGMIPLATSTDLYRALRTFTPDSLHYLLHDLFAANTFWQLSTTQATAVTDQSGKWQVTLEMEAHKAVVDSMGFETQKPLNDWVEIGVFEEGGSRQGGTPIYLQKHRIRSGKQVLTVTVPRKPAYAGIDPNHLLIDVKMDDNTKKIKIGKK